MGRVKKNIFFTTIFHLSLLLFISCVGEKGSDGRGRSGSALTGTQGDDKKGKLGLPGAGNQGAGGGTLEPNLSYISPLAELRHFVNPFTGNFKPKITIPKNYAGLLYLSGLNITSLNENIISVRFNFGREREPITVPSTIARASGLTPQTDLQVLVLDMRDKPFQDMRLLYDLYDYNAYGAGVAPVSDPKDTGLYCRGLRLEDDSTFQGSSSNVACDLPGEKCLYSYAKVKDSGLYGPTGNAEIPNTPLIDLSGADFSLAGSSTQSVSASTISGRTSNNLKKCLPDNGRFFFKEEQGFKQPTYTPVSANLALFGANVLTVLSSDNSKVDYAFKGPYRPISQPLWVLRPTAAFNLVGATEPTGLFAGSLDGSSTVEKGTLSYLFPRAGKMQLSEGVQYLGSSTAFLANPLTDDRNITSLATGGESEWMDGCNIRASNYDSIAGEGIGSCNVTASIELVTVDRETRKEKILVISNQMKLQLIRPSATDYLGREVLYQSMKTCSNSRGCAKDECCFNERCWSKELVSKCIEESGAEGNFRIGESCSSDYQCISLCCNKSTGRCDVHNTLLDPPVFCSKPPGDQCVTKEWCRQDTIRQCMVVNTGVTAEGRPTCSLQCYNRLQNGDCMNGTCRSPQNPDVPPFDPTNPDCSTAVDPPTSF